MPSRDRQLRTHLFAPGSKPRIVHSALASPADAVVIDLEDGIDPSRREAAHALLRKLAADRPSRPIHVRIATESGGYRRDDLDAAMAIAPEAIRLPKAESPDAVAAVSAHLADLGMPAVLHVTVESALGLTSLDEIISASDRVDRVVFGERDFLADIGVDEPGPITTHARAVIAIQSRARGIGSPLDGAFVDLDDLDGLQRSCREARALGFGGKSAIHPSQLATISAAFSPTDDDIEQARRMIDSLDLARSHGDASVVVDGRFVDEAVARRARSVLDSEES